VLLFHKGYKCPWCIKGNKNFKCSKSTKSYICNKYIKYHNFQYSSCSVTAWLLWPSFAAPHPLVSLFLPLRQRSGESARTKARNSASPPPVSRSSCCSIPKCTHALDPKDLSISPRSESWRFASCGGADSPKQLALCSQQPIFSNPNHLDTQCVQRAVHGHAQLLAPFWRCLKRCFTRFLQARSLSVSRFSPRAPPKETSV
jgi:hypothetical protein